MKLLLLATLFAFTPPVSPAPLPPSIEKTPRMVEIEKKFNVRIVGILRTPKTDYWVFLESQASSTYLLIPVVITADGTDHDMEVARVAAENCAAYYETQMKEGKHYAR